ncbi:hypothetical protein [Haloferax mucosum]|uniref:hypothetical protein n=1 Tax=Haloferax mucosum TaxID=403181 RepID=UPI00126736DC|nr:hypothetical protein [Haloferax mucosum]
MIQADSEANKLLDYISDHGWGCNLKDGTYRKIVVPDGDDFIIVAVMLSNVEEDGSDGVFRWTSTDEEPTSVNLINTSEHTETSAVVIDGTVKEETSTFGHPDSDDITDSGGMVQPMDNTAPPGSGGVCYRCGCETVVSRNCTSYNWDCLIIAGSVWGASCAVGKIGCFLSSSGNLALWIVGDNCNICDNYKVSRAEIGYACTHED